MYPLITGLQGLNTKYKCSKKRFINYIYIIVQHSEKINVRLRENKKMQPWNMKNAQKSHINTRKIDEIIKIY